MKPHFSERTSWELGESSYAAALREARTERNDLLDLTISNPTRCGLTYSAQAILDPLAHADALTYEPDARGLRSARDAVSTYYRTHNAAVDPERIVLTASTSESYSFLFRLLCDPGDEILIGQPGYPLFDFLAALDDVTLTTYPLFHDHGWWIDVAELERRISPRTRALVVVHPNNPTGHWTTAPERASLEALCAERGLALIVDEVFLDYPLNGAEPPRSFATAPHAALTFVLSGLSKIAALPQMKLAWIAPFGPGADEAIARLEFIADTFLSVSAPVQLALPHWLDTRAEVADQILARANSNLRTLERFMELYPDRLRLFPPHAGWAAVVSLPRCGGDAHCAERLVREHGVVVHPGAFYGLTSPNTAVVSLLTEPPTLEAALQRL